MKRMIFFLMYVLVVTYSSLYAQEMSQPATGDGTKENPYQISSAAELRWFANEVNENGRHSICAKLTQDIDLNPGFTFDENGFHGVGTPVEWVAIGGSYESAYTGTFNGGGYSIKGLYSLKGGALFNIIKNDAIIQNLGVKTGYIETKINSAAGICITNHAKIQNCYNAATIIGVGYAAGICSISYGFIINCYNKGIITGRSWTGGICGTLGNDGFLGKDPFISNSYNSGRLQLTVGGSICGLLNGGSITNCYNTGELNPVYEGVTPNIGGVVGVMNGESLIENCYNIGESEGILNGGGVCGTATGHSSILSSYFLNGVANKGVYLDESYDNVSAEGKEPQDIVSLMQNSNVFTSSNGWKTPSRYENGVMYLPQLGMGDENTIVTPILYHTVDINTSQGGNISSTGGTYKYGETVTVTAIPNEGYRFVSWTNAYGQVVSTNESYTFTVTSDLSLIANFKQKIVEQYYAITVKANMGGTVNTSGGTYKEGEIVTLIATPDNGYRFVNWTTSSGSIFSTQSYYTYIMTAATAKNLIANFEKIDPSHYSVDIWAAPGGRVSHNGGTYAEGTQITVQAFPDDGYHFMYWTDANGGVLSYESVYAFTVTSNTILRANFEEELYFIHIIESPDIILRPNDFFIKWNGAAIIHAELMGEGDYTDEIRLLFKRGENGSWETLYSSGWGDFYIGNVKSDIYVKAERYTPVANEIINNENVKVYARNGNIYVQTPNLQQVNIITIDGTIIRSRKQSGLQSYEGLKPGVYLVHVNEKVLKILVSL